MHASKSAGASVRPSFRKNISGGFAHVAEDLNLSFKDNITLEKLNLQGNWIEGAGGLAMARMLEENDYITELVNFSFYMNYFT